MEDCPSRIRLALHDAVLELGDPIWWRPHTWRWGIPHKALNIQQPFGSFPIIGGYFNRQITVSGGPFTLLRADNAMASPQPYAAVHGAGYRGVYDLANPNASRYIISTGQSGNVFSPHYDDLMPIWAHGGTIAIPLDRTTIESSTVDRLTLQPPSATAAVQQAHR